MFTSRKNKQYSKDTLRSAVEHIRNGMSYHAASKKFGIPRTTLTDRCKLVLNENIGSPRVLKTTDEKKIVQWILNMEKAGLQVSKTLLLENVGKIARRINLQKGFKHGIPGQHWYKDFLKRHPHLIPIISRSMKRRESINQDQILTWFDDVEKFVSSEGYSMDIFENPQRIFSADEIGFFLTPRKQFVVIRKNSKKKFTRIENDLNDCLTVLHTINANGDMPPPLVLFPCTSIPEKIDAKIPSTWGIDRSETGWMTCENLYVYINNVFYPWIKKHEIPLPVVLFVDGNNVNINMATADFCQKVGIILLGLLPKSSHILQPCDIAIYRPIEESWQQNVVKWQMKNDGKNLKREDFSALLKDTLEQTCSKDRISYAFEHCGLFPFSPSTGIKVLSIKEVLSDIEVDSSAGASTYDIKEESSYIEF